MSDAELLSFHMGTLSGDARLRVEERLLSSQPALAEFLALKRAFEESMPVAGPSPELKERLRKDVARALAPRRIAAPRLVPSRAAVWRISLTAAAAVLVGAIASHWVFIKKPVSRAAGAEPTQNWSVDTAREVAVNLSFL